MTDINVSHKLDLEKLEKTTSAHSNYIIKSDWLNMNKNI